MASSSKLASVPDAELDAYIADLIVRKSKTRHTGDSVPDDVESSSAPSRVPNTNKRFLTSVIRNVEGHNQALLRQQEREVEREARRAKREHAGESSRLRGWSDDERSPSSSSTKPQGEDGPSSKMDRYFDEAPSEGARTSNPQQRGERNRAPRSEPSRDPGRHSDRHDKDRDKRHSSKSSSGRHHERSHHSSSRSHRSTHRERDNHDDHSAGRRSKRREEGTRSKSERKESSGRSRKRSASPPPPKKVREWDRGKYSLAF